MFTVQHLYITFLGLLDQHLLLSNLKLRNKTLKALSCATK